MKIGERLKLNTWLALVAVLLMAVALFWSYRQIGIVERNEELVNAMRKAAFERMLLRGESFLGQSPRAAVQWQVKTEFLRGLLTEAAARFTTGEERTLLQEAQRHFEETTALSELLTKTTPAGRPGAEERRKRLLSQLLLRAYNLNESLDKLYEATEKAARQTRNRGFLLTFFLLLGGGLAIIANSLATRQIIAKRLKALHQGVVRIGGGDLDHRIEATGDDELADLAAESNQMAASLKESYTAIENLHRENAARRAAEAEQAFLNSRLQTLWELANLVDADEETFSDRVMAECLAITGSRYGFFGYIDGAEKKMRSYSLSRDAHVDCHIAVRPLVFEIEQAGVWAEAVRRRTPLILNDYRRAHPAKKGLPPGHVPLTRLLSVPFLTEGKVAMIAAVANKEIDYGEEDLRQLGAFMANARLILDKKRSDDRLRRTEHRLRSLFDNAVVGIYQSTPDGRLLAANPAFARLLGYDAPGEMLAAITDVAGQLYVAPGQRRELLRRLAGEDAVKDYEIRLFRKDRTVVHVSVSARAIRNAGGTLARLEGMVEDITERRLAEEALRASEENFRRSLDDSPLGVRIVSEDGETIYANRALLDIYGYDDVEELRSRSTEDRYTPESYAAFRVRRDKRRRGEETPGAYEIAIVRKDGEVRHLQVFRKRILWDGVSQYQVLYNDITEQKQAEAALRLSEERYRAFVKQSSEAICLFEIAHAPIDTSLGTTEQLDQLYAHAVIGECNRTFAVSHGYERPEDMLGFRIGQVFPRLARENVDYLRAFIENGHQIANVETKELARDGTVKYFLNSLTGHVEDGFLLRVWGAKQDISRIKEAEAEILKLNEELEQRVRARTAELEAANREMEAFTYSVSHDLRAPLRAVDGYARILTEDYSGLLGAEGRRLCGVISASARDMGRLIDSLLSLSRLSRQEMRRIAVDMTALAEAVYRETTAPAEQVRIDFQVASLPPAQGDPALLRQVWVNLLGNAVKFSRRQERARIEVGWEKGAYFVRDNGVGFDMAYAGKLFGVFQRLHSAQEFEGTGAGLAIAQRIVHRHGGRIWGEGEAGKGATFFFTLPD